MLWPFVSRTQQLEVLQEALRGDHPGPLIVKGEQGAGRTSLLAQVGRFVDPARDALIVLSLETFVPAAALAERSEGLRPVLVLDDAHRASQEQLDALRSVHRSHGAVLVVSEPSDPSVLPSPSPVDHLRFEPDIQTITLPPLTPQETGELLTELMSGDVEDTTIAALHAATAGNPGLLHELLTGTDLAGRMSRNGSGRQLPATGPHPEPAATGPGIGLSVRGRERLLAAVGEAWEALSLDRLDVLCRLAVDSGQAREIAAIWAGAQLLGGQAAAGLRFLDSLGLSSDEEREVPGLTLARALLLCLGLGEWDRAGALLSDPVAGAAGSEAPPAQRALAQRAWLLAMMGRSAQAAELLEDRMPFADRDAAAFAYAAVGFVALAENDPGTAVWGLRRALVSAERVHRELPWLTPCLTACLIDALFLSGRISEATEVAAELHAERAGSGWDVAVSLSALSGLRWPHPVTATASVPAS